MSVGSDSISLLRGVFGAGDETRVISVPGRVNLIGEHIDYHNLPVLPMALSRRIHVAFRARRDNRIRAVGKPPNGLREFVWDRQLHPGAAGDWENYLKAAAQAVAGRWGPMCGVDAAVASDLPSGAGLSSSSALLTAFALALLAANGVNAGFEELMDVLPEGEYFVGTRGGGMDHAAVLASRAGCALLVEFAPLAATPVPVPESWSFLVAHSLTIAEKSGAVREEFNARRAGGMSALEKLGLASFRQALEKSSEDELRALAARRLDNPERGIFLHVVEEALRVRRAVSALRSAEAEAFGGLLNRSHESLRDQLRISTPALDALVQAALDSGALGARLTGAGFGGCAVVFCRGAELEQVRAGIEQRYFAGRGEYDPHDHLINALPSNGALHA